MKKRKVSREFLEKCKKRIRLFVSVILAGMLLWNGSGIAQATTLADIFDARQYADRYSDLKEAFGYDEKALLEHYLTYGIAEGRDGFGLLDVRKYREKYPDLDAAFGDNWDAYVDHYLTYGIKEHRDPGTDFDPLAYMERYEDLEEAFGDDALALYQHYMIFGKNEGRDAKKEAPVQNRGGANGGQSGNAVKDPNGKLETQYWGPGSYTVFEYDSEGKYTGGTIYSDGSVIGYFSYEYDEQGNYTETAVVGGIVSHVVVYDSTGKEISGVSYYDNGNPSQVWDNVTRKAIFYNYDGNVSGYSIKEDISERVTKQTFYDEDGTPTSYTIVEYGDSRNIERKRTSYRMDGSIFDCSEYDENGYVTKMTYYNEDGSFTCNLYEVVQISEGFWYSRSTGVYNSDGSYAVYEYTDAGKMAKMFDYHANGVMYICTEYDENENPCKHTYYNEDGSVDSYSLLEVVQRDPSYSFTRETATYYADGSYTLYEYTSEMDPFERNEKVYNADGTLRMLIINEYDEQGNLFKWTGYDAEGNMLAYCLQEAGGIWHYYPVQ